MCLMELNENNPWSMVEIAVGRDESDVSRGEIIRKLSELVKVSR